MTESRTLTFAYSPCPNDTFMFHGITRGGLCLPGFEIETCFHDVETLNELALAERFDVTKLSFHGYLHVRNKYELLRAGAAIGFGCGPVLVSKKEMCKSDIGDYRIVVPGKLTTAHLLFRLWAPENENLLFARYDEIMPMIESGEADGGVIIHEGRFVYENSGFQMIRDLGEWWEEETGLPIPLGCIAVRKELGTETIAKIEGLIRRSIDSAYANPAATDEYVRENAQEIDKDVLDKHIKTYVNEYSLDIGEDGLMAIEKMCEMAEAAGLLK